MNNSFKVVIPARYASTRLPGKMLQEIAGKPMIQHVYERALQSDAQAAIIATDDARIEDAALKFGATVVMTSDRHQSGTDRIHEVCEKQQWKDDEVIVGLQGDEPLIPAAVINQVAQSCIQHADAGMATLCEVIESVDIFTNPNAVKVVTDNLGYALYFSRAPIPWPRDNGDTLTKFPNQIPQQCMRHIGIYAYRVELLKQFVQWPAALLEAIEKLEQLRVLSNGKKIHVAPAVEPVPPGVDTLEDLQHVRTILEK